MRPTVHDIAREAGVSLATVDRVLNARPGVREATIARVRDAVTRLGYIRDTSAANLSRQRLYRFVAVLPDGQSQFVKTIVKALREAHASAIGERVQLRILPVPSQDPHQIVRALRRLDLAKLDGVAIMAPETPQLRDAIHRLKQGGVAVVTLVSDQPTAPRDHFIGIDNVAAGRTAGLLMGRFTGGAGEIMVLSNSMRSRDSLERRLGFDAVMASDFPQVRVLPSIDSYDDTNRLTVVVREVLRRHPAMSGVYSMGSGNTALLDVLLASGRLPGLVVIAHELTPTTRQALLSDRMSAVITQNVGHLVRSALRVLRALSDGLPIFEAQERIRIEIALRENLP
jgi:LacI family transcriptional regulator